MDSLCFSASWTLTVLHDILYFHALILTTLSFIVAPRRTRVHLIVVLEKLRDAGLTLGLQIQIGCCFMCLLKFCVGIGL